MWLYENNPHWGGVKKQQKKEYFHLTAQSKVCSFRLYLSDLPTIIVFTLLMNDTSHFLLVYI